VPATKRWQMRLEMEIVHLRLAFWRAPMAFIVVVVAVAALPLLLLGQPETRRPAMAVEAIAPARRLSTAPVPKSTSPSSLVIPEVGHAAPIPRPTVHRTQRAPATSTPAGTAVLTIDLPDMTVAGIAVTAAVVGGERTADLVLDRAVRTLSVVLVATGAETCRWEGLGATPISTEAGRRLPVTLNIAGRRSLRLSVSGADRDPADCLIADPDEFTRPSAPTAEVAGSPGPALGVGCRPALLGILETCD
jgi:hypothetical protein